MPTSATATSCSGAGARCSESSLASRSSTSLTLLVNLALLPIALRVTPFNIYVVQALFAGAVVICSYLAHKYYSFGGRSHRDSGDAPSYDPTAVSKD